MGTIRALDADASPPADVFVVGAFVGVLEATPTADIVNQDGVEFCLPALNILINRFSASRPCSRRYLALVGIGLTISMPRCAA
jgi:hypothetical protein